MKMYRRKELLKLYGGREVQVRYAIPDRVTIYPPKDGQEGSVFIEGEDEASKEVPTLCPRNVAFDSKDADERQWATGMKIAVKAFFSLYEHVD